MCIPWSFDASEVDLNKEAPMRGEDPRRYAVPIAVATLLLGFVLPEAGTQLAGQQCQRCDAELCLDENWHDVHTFGSPPELDWSGEPHGCVFGSCEGHGHTSQLCDAEVLATVEVVWGLALSNPDRLRDALEADPDRLSFNPHRAALQFMGCDGQVLAHIPLRMFPEPTYGVFAGR